jgi:3-oxoacyl-[acyl-carrier-protein] synthase-3
MRAKIVSTGFYVPPKIETAEDLAPRIGKSADWILEHTGVAKRHVAEEPMEVMGAKAARQALGDGPEPDLILNASTTPRQTIPDSSVFITRELGYEGLPCHSIHATCLSFLVALHHAYALVHSGAYRRILVVTSEMGSIARNWDEPESSVLLGDAAGAAIVEPTPAGEDAELLGYRINTWPSGAEYTELPGGGIRRHPNDPNTRPVDNLFHMDGPAVYKMARRRAGLVLAQTLGQAGLKPTDLDLVVPHQASGKALKAIPDYGIPEERVVNIVAEYGNCIAASIPLALAIAHRRGRLKRGNRLLMAGTGAGLSVGALLVRW